MRNQAINDDIISRSAKPIAVPSIATKGRKFKSSEKKKTAITVTKAELVIHLTAHANTFFLSSESFVLECIIHLVECENKNIIARISKS